MTRSVTVRWWMRIVRGGRDNVDQAVHNTTQETRVKVSNYDFYVVLATLFISFD